MNTDCAAQVAGFRSFQLSFCLRRNWFCRLRLAFDGREMTAYHIDTDWCRSLQWRCTAGVHVGGRSNRCVSVEWDALYMMSQLEGPS